MTKDQIREIFLGAGFTIKEGQTDLRPYVYDAAYCLLSASIADTAGAKTVALWAAFAPEGNLLAHSKLRPGLSDILNWEPLYRAAPPAPSVADEMASAGFMSRFANEVADAAGASDARIAALEEAYQAALSCDGALNNAGAVAMKIRALIKRDDATAASKDAIEAKRYRFLRENMRFSSPRDETPTMTLRAPIPAPTHDIHNDWMGERFDASVDRTIDAALAKELRK
jgi:hypothetical protein